MGGLLVVVARYKKRSVLWSGRLVTVAHFYFAFNDDLLLYLIV